MYDINMYVIRKILKAKKKYDNESKMMICNDNII